MKVFFAFALSFLILGSAFAQELTRQQKVQQISELNDKIQSIQRDLLQPAEEDSRLASSKGLTAVTLLPRGVFDGRVADLDGGAYYSFSTGSHSYYKTPQIQLEKKMFSVGFSGADYGFMTDLGTRSIANLTGSAPELNYMADYRSPKYEKEIRAEYSFFSSGRAEGGRYSKYLPVVEGHSYLLRAISFNEADILVGFDVLRVDPDGSVTIAFKKFSEFEKPIMLAMSDKEMKAAIDQIIETNELKIVVEVKDNVLIYRGYPTAEEIKQFHIALSGGNIRTRGEDFSQRSGSK